MTRSARFFAMFVVMTSTFSSSALAGVVNGSFESGMSGWTTVGPNSAIPTGFVNVASVSPIPTDLLFMAYIHNAGGALPVFLQDLVLASKGLPAGYIAGNFPSGTQGGLLFQKFTLGAAEAGIEFDWNFLTDEGLGGMGNNDFAFAHLLSSTNVLSGSAYVDTTTAGFSTGMGADYDAELGWQTVSFGGLTPGDTYTLVFGVFDAVDNFSNSGLLVDRIIAIPEPGSALLVGLTSLGLACVRRRRR